MTTVRSRLYAPESLDSLIEFISAHINAYYEKTGLGVDGAGLAYLIKKEYPDINYNDLGVLKLGDVIHIAESKGLLKRRDNVQHLEILPVKENNSIITKPITKVGKLSYINQDVWRSVILANDYTSSFINKNTKLVTSIPKSNKKQLAVFQSNPNEIELFRVDKKEHVDWLRQFLSEKNQIEKFDNDLSSIINDVYNRLPRELYRDWKYFRARKVIGKIDNWAKDNSISTEEILIPAKHRHSLDNGIQNSKDNEEILRRLLISAIRIMPQDELEKIIIPIKYLQKSLKY